MAAADQANGPVVDKPQKLPATDDKQPPASQHKSLKYSLLGPSLLKAGQDSVDQSKVSEIIYNASKGSKYFNREEAKDKVLTAKIDQILAKKARLQNLDLSHDLRLADTLIAQLELSRDLSQSIVHLDCDAFYASVELLDRPELEHLPFAVGGGVLTTCNYVARKFGCRSGMAGFVAKKLCPELILIKNNFEKYNAKAHEIRDIIATYDERFESASIDEAYLNITPYCEEHGISAPDAIDQLRREIAEKTKITVSAGIAANAKLAKICSNLNKPNGQYVLPSDRESIMSFMRSLPCRKVNGIGRVFERQLAAVGVETCGDIYDQRMYLRQLFGDKAFDFLIHCHLGLGRTSVQPAEEYERKSVGTESTFHEMADPAALREKLRWTAEELEKDMRRAECKGRTLCLKVKMATFEVYTRQVVTPFAVHAADDLYNLSLPMLVKLEQEFPGLRLRLMGLRCTHLVSTKKADTMAFFGFKTRRTESGEPAEPEAAHRDTSKKPDGEDGEWEEWPEGPEEALDGGYIDDDGSPKPEGIAEVSPYRRHGKEIVPNPKKGASPPPEEWWNCPICGRPQAVDERQFNEHIDLCLSRQTIKDTVQQDRETSTEAPKGGTTTPENGRKSSNNKVGADRKRGRPPSSASDPRQKKLCFG